MDVNSKQLYLTSLRDIFPTDHVVIDEQKSSSENITVDLCKRLRPEFLKIYQGPICSDGLTPTSGATRSEREVNDANLMRACKFLREAWIPGFIKALDSLEVRPFDSRTLTLEMHQRGINMRYLGIICQKSTIPFIRTLALIEMIARACKHEFRTRLREAILHFRSVGATSIENEMKQYASSIFGTVLGNSERSKSFFESKLKPRLLSKFQHNLTFKQFSTLYRPAIFIAMQYHVFLKINFLVRCHIPRWTRL